MYTGHQDAEWRPFLQAIHSKLTDQAFETWFRPLRLSTQCSGGVLRIAAPNDVVRDWILSKYAEPLRQSLNESHLGSLRIEWQIASHNSMPSEVAEPLPRESDRVQLQSAESALPEVGLSDVFAVEREIHFQRFRGGVM
jgi:chromosomal replication initiation ATPase DnaA